MDVDAIPIPERKAYLKLLLVLAAADGEVSASEREVLSGVARRFGFPFKKEAYLAADLDAAAAAIETPKLRGILLKDLERLAARDGRISGAELGVIKRLADGWDLKPPPITGVDWAAVAPASRRVARGVAEASAAKRAAIEAVGATPIYDRLINPKNLRRFIAALVLLAAGFTIYLCLPNRPADEPANLWPLLKLTFVWPWKAMAAVGVPEPARVILSVPLALVIILFLYYALALAGVFGAKLVSHVLGWTLKRAIPDEDGPTEADRLT